MECLFESFDGCKVANCLGSFAWVFCNTLGKFDISDDGTVHQSFEKLLHSRVVCEVLVDSECIVERSSCLVGNEFLFFLMGGGENTFPFRCVAIVEFLLLLSLSLVECEEFGRGRSARFLYRLVRWNPHIDCKALSFRWWVLYGFSGLVGVVGYCLGHGV